MALAQDGCRKNVLARRISFDGEAGPQTVELIRVDVLVDVRR